MNKLLFLIFCGFSLAVLTSCKDKDALPAPLVNQTIPALVLQVEPALPPALDYSKLPPRSQEHIPTLLEQKEHYWPEMDSPSIFCSQIEQETCPSPTHRMCWSPTAELKTSREQGVGLGQVTRTWDAQGNLRFDVLAELKNKHKEALAEWSWKNVTNALFQLRALVLMDRDLFNAVNFAETLPDQYAFMAAAYNGGLGGVSQDRAVCRGSQGCNPNVWFGHVEHHSTKAKTAHAEYSKSFFQINREYVTNILKVRRAKYVNAGLS